MRTEPFQTVYALRERLAGGEPGGRGTEPEALPLSPYRPRLLTTDGFERWQGKVLCTGTRLSEQVDAITSIPEQIVTKTVAGNDYEGELS